MFQEKIKQIAKKIQQDTLKTLKLLWQFKWFVALDIVCVLLLICEYLNPPAADSAIWKSEAMLGAWNYQNQQFYIQSCKYSLIISTLLFLLGCSNMRTHPNIAKIIFLFPIYLGWMGLL